MRFLVDAQLPPALARWLGDAGCEALHVADGGMSSASDRAIARRAADEQWTVITKDADFAQLRLPDRFALIWLRCGNVTNPKLLAWLRPRWPRILQMVTDGERSIEVR